MLDIIKRAIINNKVNEVKTELQRVGTSIEGLITRPDLLDQLDSLTAWGLLDGLEAALRVIEQTVTGVIRDNEAMQSDVRTTLRDVQAAAATLQGTLAGIEPYVEHMYEKPSVKTKWDLVPPR